MDNSGYHDPPPKYHPEQPQYPAYPHHGVPAYPGIQGTYPGGSQPQVVVVQAQSYPATDINGKPIDSVKPVQANCQSCHKTVRTRVQESIRDLGWIWCIACCLLTGWCWVALLACCMNGFKQFTHWCPDCKIRLAVVKPDVSTKEKIILCAVIGGTVLLGIIFAIVYVVVIVPIVSQATINYIEEWERQQNYGK